MFAFLNNKKKQKGQGAIEYLLIIGAAILVAAIVLAIVIKTTKKGEATLNNTYDDFNNVVNDSLNNAINPADGSANTSASGNGADAGNGSGSGSTGYGNSGNGSSGSSGSGNNSSGNTGSGNQNASLSIDDQLAGCIEKDPNCPFNLFKTYFSNNSWDFNGMIHTTNTFSFPTDGSFPSDRNNVIIKYSYNQQANFLYFFNVPKLKELYIFSTVNGNTNKIYICDLSANSYNASLERIKKNISIYESSFCTEIKAQ